MKKNFENIIKATQALNDKQQEFVIKNLDEINNRIKYLQLKVESLTAQITGVTSLKYNDAFVKAIQLLKLFGFTESNFESFSSDFINWFVEESTKREKYNPKLMNYYMLISLNQAYIISYAMHEGKVPNLAEVKRTMLTFDELIQEYEQELNLSLPELIEKIENNC